MRDAGCSNKLTAVQIETRRKMIKDLENRREQLEAQLDKLGHAESLKQTIFATIRAGSCVQLQHLLQAGIYSVAVTDYHGATPLHVAAHEGREDMVEMLLAFGADVFALDKRGRTPRDLAVARRHAALGRFLYKEMRQHSGMPANQSIEDLAGEEGQPKTSPTLADPGDFIGVGSREDLAAAAAPVPPVTGDDSNSEGLSHTLSHTVAGMTSPKMNNDAVVAASAIALKSTSYTYSHFCTVSDDQSLIICLVGLPGRGKSFISRCICRYLNWKGVPCRVFNAGDYRRKLLGADCTSCSNFYDPNNPAGKAAREEMAQMATQEMLKFVDSHPISVGILDATNTTVERRQYLLGFIREHERTNTVLLPDGSPRRPARIIFIESVCDDESIITENILRAKCGNDDFKNVHDPNVVIKEFRERIKQYEKVYETVSEKEDNHKVCFIKIINVKQRVLLHRVRGGLTSRVAFFLMNLHPVAYPVFVCTNGETVGAAQGKFGGDEHLTEAGALFARRLHEFIKERLTMNYQHSSDGAPLRILCGTNAAVEETLRLALHGPAPDGSMAISLDVLRMRALDDLNYGTMSGQTESEARRSHPKMSAKLFVTKGSHPDEPPENTVLPSLVSGSFTSQFDSSTTDTILCSGVTMPRLSYTVSFPRGESCRQCNVRLENAIFEILRAPGPVLVLAPRAAAQGIFAFLTDVLPEMSPQLDIPWHSVLEVGVKRKVITHTL